jgi:hypothetical protein
MKTESGQLNEAYFAPPKDYRSPEGYKKARWGMSTREVQRVFPAARRAPGGKKMDGLAMTDSVGGRQAHVLLGFAKGALAVVAANIEPRSPSKPQGYVEDYDEMQEKLTKKYGAAEVSVRWSDDALKDKPHLLAVAVAMGHADLQSVWWTGESMIVLSLEGENRRPKLRLVYSSNRLSRATREGFQQAQQAEADDL